MIKPRGIPSPTSAWQPPSGACVSGTEELEMGDWEDDDLAVGFNPCIVYLATFTTKIKQI